MSTLNPLFLDSTKPVGDKSITNIELHQIFLRDDEALYFEITNTKDMTQRFNMTPIVTKKAIKYQTDVWLKQEYQGQCRFVIESSGRPVFTSKIYQILAGQNFSEIWEPCFDTPLNTLESNKRRMIKNQATKDPKRLREFKSPSLKSLCEPHIVDQIKNLLDDL